MNKKKKGVLVYKDGQLFGDYESIIEAIYDLHISYASIRKSIFYNTYIKGYKFKFHYKDMKEAVA